MSQNSLLRRTWSGIGYRLTAFILILIAQTGSATQKLGDIDGDGQPTVLDITAILNHINGTQRLSNEASVIADVNQDGVVNQLDVDLVADAILGISVLPDLPLNRIVRTSPGNGDNNVSVTRETIIHFAQPLATNTLITTTSFYAQFAGQKQVCHVALSSDRRTVTLFYNYPLPGNAHIMVTFNGTGVNDFLNRPIDADGDGQPGGTAIIQFDTLSQTPLPNTIVAGRIFASQLTTNTSGTNTSMNTPLPGVRVEADGLEQDVWAVSDQNGDFRLTNAPPGNFFVHIRGHLLTNVAAGIRFPDLAYYPDVGKEWQSIASHETNIGEIYLPLIVSNTLQSVSVSNTTAITFPAAVLAQHPDLQGVTLYIPPNSLYSDNGTRGGLVGIAPVPADRLPGPLPTGLKFPLVITVQTDGPQNFDGPVPVCFPNLPDPTTGVTLGPGAKTALWSFNHDTGQWEIRGSMTVSPDGHLACSDPGVGILAPGWHAVAPGTPGCCGPGTTTGNNDPPLPGLPFWTWLQNLFNPGEKPPTDPSKDPKAPTDPVVLSTGEFQENEEDLHIPGVGFDFVWERTYRSKNSPNRPIAALWDAVALGPQDQQAVQGIGWDFNYNMHMTQSGRGIFFDDGAGRNDLYRQLPTLDDIRRYYVSGARYAMEPLIGGIGLNRQKITLPNGTTWTFNALDSSVTSGKLASIVDRNGNTMTFNYDSQGRLFQVIDTLGRLISLSYNVFGFLSDITDFAGRVVHYEYYGLNEPGGSFGDLKSVTKPAVTGTPNGNDFPNGKTTAYTYSKGYADENLNHNLLTITDGRRNDTNDVTYGQGPYLVNVYTTVTDPNNFNYDRVAHQVWGGARVDMTYVEQSPNSGNNNANTKTIVNDRNGHVKEFFYDAANRLVVLHEFTGQATIGQPVTDVSNRPVNRLRPGDPAYFETLYSYNSDNLATQIIYPNGNITLNVYEGDINTNATSTMRQNLRKVTHLPGAHQPAGDQNIITEQYTYLTNFDFVTSHTDGRGNISVNQYDGLGNLTNVTHRLANITEQFAYNSAGQMTRHVLPDNGSGIHRADTMSYYGSGAQRGYLYQRIVDAAHLALATTYQYDSVGNVIRKIDPRGRDTLYVVNALNQVVRETSREVTDNSGIRYQRDLYYDADDNLTRTVVLNKDDTGALEAKSTLATTYEYEILDKLSRKTQEVSATNSVVTDYTYDNNRNLILSRMGEAVAGRQSNNIVQLKYDERDLLFQEIKAPGDAAQSTTQFDYDGNRNVVDQWQGLESQTRFTQKIYDGFNRLVSVIDPLGNITSANFDANGNTIHRLTRGELTDVAGAAGNVRLAEATFAFDEQDRMTNETNLYFDPATQSPIGKGSAVSTFIYTDNSRTKVVINDNSHGATNYYDSAGRLSSSIDAKGNVSAYTYDPNGNLVAREDSDKSDLGNTTQNFFTNFKYDNLDRLIQQTQSCATYSNSVSYGYDSRANQLVKTDADGNVTRNVFDGLNRLVTRTIQLTSTGLGGGSASGTITTRQTWDDDSRLTSQADDSGNATRYTYDALNRRAVTSFADGTGMTNVFDPHNNPILSYDARGTVVTNTYDLLNRLSRRDVSPGAGVSAATTFETFSYDGLSRIVNAQNNVSLVTRAYDSLSHLSAEVQTGLTNRWFYDGVGNILAETYPGGRAITNTFDELERKRMIADGSGQLAHFDFLGAVRVERLNYGDGTRCDYAYDGNANFQLGSLNFTNANNGASPVVDRGFRQVVRTLNTRVSDGTVIDDHTYAWDGMGNKLQRQDLRASAAQPIQNFAYDSDYRLVRSARGPPVGSVVTNTYSFDGVGNRVAVTGTNAGSYSLDPTLPEPADRQLNQYTTTPFDARKNDPNGNLTNAVSTQSVTRNLVYDYQNRLVSFTNLTTGTGATYAYDPFGRRILKTITGDSPQTTRFLHDGWREIEERDGSNNVQATYVYGLHIDEVLTMRRGGNDFYYHADDLHNVTAITQVGMVAERYDYSDYGTVVVSTSGGGVLAATAIGNPWQMTGRRFDAESGLLYFRSRYLDSVSGRFTSRDTVGMWYDSSSLGNGSAFVGNNPWSYGDPWGLSKPKSLWDRGLDWLSTGIADSVLWSGQNTPWLNAGFGGLSDFSGIVGKYLPFSSLYLAATDPNSSAFDYAMAIAQTVPIGKVVEAADLLRGAVAETKAFDVFANLVKDESSIAKVSPQIDFYVSSEGVAIPSTGYRAIPASEVSRAFGGDIMSQSGNTYITFDNLGGLSSSEARNLLQLPNEPAYFAKFDTLQISKDLKIPGGQWNSSLIPEPMATTFPKFGTGGGTQAITTTPINSSTLTPFP